MENKNEQQKQNLIWIFVILVLLIICIIMFIQNKKIEKMMAIINRNYDSQKKDNFFSIASKFC